MNIDASFVTPALFSINVLCVHNALYMCSQPVCIYCVHEMYNSYQTSCKKQPIKRPLCDLRPPTQSESLILKMLKLNNVEVGATLLKEREQDVITCFTENLMKNLFFFTDTQAGVSRRPNTFHTKHEEATKPLRD